MKELTKKFRILVFISVVTVIIGGLLYAADCIRNGYNLDNRRPNDKLSRTVREATGNDFYYQGKHEDVFGGRWYEYLIKKKDRAAIANLVNALNNSVENEQIKIGVQVGTDFPHGIEYIFTLENFSDDGLEVADYDGMYAIYIREPDVVDDECFYDPSIYTEIEGIRKLCIEYEMQQGAEKQGIDWYEVWPDLEEIKVIKR